MSKMAIHMKVYPGVRILQLRYGYDIVATNTAILLMFRRFAADGDPDAMRIYDALLSWSKTSPGLINRRLMTAMNVYLNEIMCRPRHDGNLNLFFDVI